MNEILEKFPISIPVTEAAKLMGKTPMFIRCGLRAQRFDFGTAVMMNKQWSYFIATKKLLNYLGVYDDGTIKKNDEGKKN